MKTIKFKEFKEVVGQGFITLKAHNFPQQGWCRKTIGNVIYIWAKPSVILIKLSEIEQRTGKEIRLCLVPKAIINRVGL